MMKLESGVIPVTLLSWKFTTAFGALLLLLFPMGFAFAQATKCVVNGKTLYTDGSCPAGTKENRMKSEGGIRGYPGLPDVQRGRWGIDAGDFRDGNPYVEKVCGNPLSIVVKELERIKTQGCNSQITNPTPGTTHIAVSCKAGNGGSKHISEFVIVRRSSRSLTLLLKTNSGDRNKVEMNRIGEC